MRGLQRHTSACIQWLRATAVASTWHPGVCTGGPGLVLTLPERHAPVAPALQGIAEHSAHHALSQYGLSRHYAKQKGVKKRATVASPPAEAPDEEAQEFSLDEFEGLMQQAVDYYQHELAGVRTGRANPGLLENVAVNAHGDHVPLKAVAAVTVRNPQLLAVSVYDPQLAGTIQRAIQDSPLGLNPSIEGSELLVKLPRMTKETIEKMVKLVHSHTEGVHVSVRRARQKALDAIKKAFKGLSEDERKRMEKEVQKLHDKYMNEVERLKKIKDTELREHKD